jgi:hypothetical protein
VLAQLVERNNGIVEVIEKKIAMKGTVEDR